MQNTIHKNTIFLVMTTALILSACGKKTVDYGDITASKSNTQVRKVSFDVNITPEPSVLNQNNSEDRQILEQKLEDLYDQFLKMALIVEPGTNFLTKVNYDGLYQLRNNLDTKYLKLTEAIRLKLEDAKSLDGKSENYKKAFYINAYNYNIILVIIRNYMKDNKKIDSIRDIRGKLDFDQNSIFKQKELVFIAGERLSFEQLENKAFPNAQVKDERIIFALAKGCHSCSVLLDEAYRENKIDEQLNEITRLSLRLPFVVSNDHVSKITNLNNLFKWYKSIFDQPKNGGIAAFLLRNGPIRSYEKIEYQSFDWTLNQSKETAPINTTDIPIITAPKTNPCATFLNGTDYKSMVSCQKVVNGKTANIYKYTVELAHLCILTKTVNKKKELKVVGRLEEYETQNNDQETRLDMGSTDFKLDERTGIISFDHKSREISAIEYDSQRMELKISQRYRFWSLDMFKKKKLRSFILSCQATE